MLTIVLLNIFLTLFFTVSFISCTEIGQSNKIKYKEGEIIVLNTTLYFYELFEDCLETTMPNKNFYIDDLQAFIVNPEKTTVGYAPKFTGYRKFFANLLQTTEFKEMLNKDERAIRKNLISKLQFCDTAVLDQDILKEFYDRETDPSKY